MGIYPVIEKIMVKFLTTSMSGFGLLVASIAAGPAAAQQDNHPHEDIQRVAERFAMAQIDTTGLTDVRATANAMDSRLTLKRCEQALETFATSSIPNASRLTVGVRCNGQKPWTLYVPVSVEAMAEALYTARPVLRGEALVTNSIEVRQVPLQDLPLNAIRSMDELAGLEASRALSAGTALSLNTLKARQLIKQGQQVVIRASGRGIQVKMAGTALKNGASGELIPVRNSNSGRIVRAAVIDDSTVQVNM